MIFFSGKTATNLIVKSFFFKWQIFNDNDYQILTKGQNPLLTQQNINQYLKPIFDPVLLVWNWVPISLV